MQQFTASRFDSRTGADHAAAGSCVQNLSALGKITPGKTQTNEEMTFVPSTSEVHFLLLSKIRCVCEFTQLSGKQKKALNQQFAARFLTAAVYQRCGDRRMSSHAVYKHTHARQPIIAKISICEQFLSESSKERLDALTVRVQRSNSKAITYPKSFKILLKKHRRKIGRICLSSRPSYGLRTEEWWFNECENNFNIMKSIFVWKTSFWSALIAY